VERASCCMIRLPGFLFLVLYFTSASAQVKPEYLYNTTLPFGTLDIRTKISPSTLYYLEENKTFSFRESAPGVRTNTFADITSWDSSPYGEGHMRKKNGTTDEFIMNYRLLKPLNYDPNFSDGYSLIVIMHGAVERGNCYYDECYHSDWNYNPNANVPPAPTNPDNRLLNNDYHLTQSAKEHLVARNLAGTRLPNDPTMPANAFPGFVLMPQMLNVWDSLTVEDMIRVVLLHVEKYKINPDRVYIHGLSIGGYATYEAIKRAPWLFAAALPMSAVTEAGNIFKHNQQDKVVHIPIWTFQGGLDKKPSPEFTQAIVNKFKAAGASIQQTVYPDLSHRVWARAYQEPNFFSWILSKRKNNIHALYGITQINSNTGVFPKLVLPEGFFAYQWEKDGSIVTSATTNRLTVTSAGSYRARFSRKASPGPADWNAWSLAIVITATAPAQPPADPPAEEEPVEEEPPVEEPVDETPVEEDPPVEEEPDEDEPPVEEPVEEDPVEEEPVEEEPVEEDPTEDDPVEEPDDEQPDDPGENPAEDPGDDEGEPENPAEDPEENPSEQGDGGTDDPDLNGNEGNEIEDHDGEGTVTGVSPDPLMSFSVFPNPTSSANINLLLQGRSQYYSIKIVDMVGAVKFQNKYVSSGQPYRLDDLKLNDGVYVLNISDGKSLFTHRLVIQSR
jgi:hypothetical protein